MRRYIRLLFLTLFITALLCLNACQAKEAVTETPVGAWKNVNETDKTETLYAFTENGHVLTVSTVAGAVTGVASAHYTFDGSAVAITENGKENGKLTASFDGADTMTLTAEGAGSLTFARTSVKQSPLIGNWVYYSTRDGESYAEQLALTGDFQIARAVYEGESMTDYTLSGYLVQGDLLSVIPENGGDITVFRIAFPYEGYMTVEDVTDAPTDGTPSIVRTFSRLES